MKSKCILFFGLILLLGILSGCAFAPVVPPRGIMYNSQKAPLYGGRTTGSKKGEASTHNVLMLVGWGDCSINAAAKNGNIKTVKNVDYDLLSFFIFYQRFTTIVYGETELPKARPGK